MCYLKNLKTTDNLDLDDFTNKAEETEQSQVQAEDNVLIPCVQKHIAPMWSHEQQMLISLFELVQKNNSIIRSMNKVRPLLTQSINGNSEYIEKGSIQTENQIKNQDIFFRENSEKQESRSISYESSSLISKLFGVKKYKYALQISQPFPKIIYKQRNFQLQLKLVDMEGKIIRNCNILNLCCAISSTEAEWIHENRIGEPFLKGKTQVELYKGEASFVKIYAREVSRVYPEGNINIVIYSKPSTLLYSGSNSFELSVNSQEIKPLIIQDVTIKAKKKE